MLRQRGRDLFHSTAHFGQQLSKDATSHIWKEARINRLCIDGPGLWTQMSRGRGAHALAQWRGVMVSHPSALVPSVSTGSAECRACHCPFAPQLL